MFPVSINPLSIAVCIILKMILGFIWYSPAMFGKTWLKLIGKKASDIRIDAGNLFLTGVAALVKVMATAVLVYWIGAFTWQAGLMVGLVMGIGIVATDNASSVIWEGKSLQLFLIDAGIAVLGFVMTGIVLAVMANPV